MQEVLKVLKLSKIISCVMLEERNLIIKSLLDKDKKLKLSNDIIKFNNIVLYPNIISNTIFIKDNEKVLNYDVNVKGKIVFIPSKIVPIGKVLELSIYNNMWNKSIIDDNINISKLLYFVTYPYGKESIYDDFIMILKKLNNSIPRDVVIFKSEKKLAYTDISDESLAIKNARNKYKMLCNKNMCDNIFIINDKSIDKKLFRISSRKLISYKLDFNNKKKKITQIIEDSFDEEYYHFIISKIKSELDVYSDIAFMSVNYLGKVCSFYEAKKSENLYNTYKTKVYNDIFKEQDNEFYNILLDFIKSFIDEVMWENEKVYLQRLCDKLKQKFNETIESSLVVEAPENLLEYEDVLNKTKIQITFKENIVEFFSKVMKNEIKEFLLDCLD